MLLSRLRTLKLFGTFGTCAAFALCTVYIAKSAAQSARQGQPPADTAIASSNASPIYGVTIPAGYRDWKVIAVAQLLVPGKADQLRAQLGNEIAFKAFKEGTIPFPDGAIIAAIHWNRLSSEDNNKV